MRLVDVLVGDLGVLIGDLDARILAQFDVRNDLELGLEAQRLAGVEMDVVDVRRAHHVQVLFLELLCRYRGIRFSSTFWRISPS